MHSIVTDLRDVRGSSAVRQWTHGLALPFRAVAFLRRHRSLWPWVAAPALIGILLFGGVVAGAVLYADDLLALWWTQPTGDGLWTAVLSAAWSVLYAVLLILGVASAYLVALLLGGVIASPFNDALSARAEHILTGDADTPEAVETWTGIGRSILSTLIVTCAYVVCAVPVLALNLLPGLGPLLATVLNTGLAAAFLSLEYADVAFARYGLTWREKLRLLRTHRSLAFGFGLSTSALLWIPGLNLVVMPIAVTGGTALALALHRHTAV
jgi:CysZ protein